MSGDEAVLGGRGMTLSRRKWHSRGMVRGLVKCRRKSRLSGTCTCLFKKKRLKLARVREWYFIGGKIKVSAGGECVEKEI